MKAIRPMLSTKEHRQWHNDWHSIRSLVEDIDIQPRKTRALTLAQFEEICPSPWPPSQENNLPLTGDQLKERKQHVKQVRAELSKKGIKGSFKSFARLHGEGDGTLSGEDFLYMHREMIKMVNLELVAHGQPCIAPWTQLPELDDPNWPIYTGGLWADRERKKANKRGPLGSDQISKHGKMMELESRLKDPKYLRRVTLSQLGSCIEFSLHSYMHNAYNDRPNVCEDEVKDVADVCDDLAPFWSSHVNRHFWKLHGLIDQFIGLWLEANGKGEIAKNCGREKNCYQWKAVCFRDFADFLLSSALERAVGPF